mmetsp:Transcript_35244/g.84483  ORF Transcript_35244/g.84483 Transcript_35244/m.84483 type:complete len:212 (-) Transcript_35244:210-845(-)
MALPVEGLEHHRGRGVRVVGDLGHLLQEGLALHAALHHVQAVPLHLQHMLLLRLRLREERIRIDEHQARCAGHLDVHGPILVLDQVPGGVLPPPGMGPLGGYQGRFFLKTRLGRGRGFLVVRQLLRLHLGVRLFKGAADDDHVMALRELQLAVVPTLPVGVLTVLVGHDQLELDLPGTPDRHILRGPFRKALGSRHARNTFCRIPCAQLRC